MNYFLDMLDRVTGAYQREKEKHDDAAKVQAMVQAQNEAWMRECHTRYSALYGIDIEE